MRGLGRPMALLALGTALALAAFALPANADTGNIIMPQNHPPTAADGWQAGTCKTDVPPCSPNSLPAQFFTQAAGHPPVGYTQYIIRHNTVEPVPGLVLEPIEEPIEDRTIKTLRVDLPPGLTVNPEAAPQCSVANFERVVEVEPGKKLHIPNCTEASVVGLEEVTLVTNVEGFEPLPGKPVPKGFVFGPEKGTGTIVPVYDLTPKEGEPALFGFVVAGQEVVYLTTDVAWETDYHEAFTIRLPGQTPPFSTLKSRLVNFGQAGNGTFLTTPTTCFNPEETAFQHIYSTFFRAESYGEPDPNFPNGSTPVESELPPGVHPTGCEAVPFEPSLEVLEGNEAVDSPAAPTVNTKMPFIEGGATISESHLRSAKVTLPEGMGLNPSAANVLQACTDAQFGKGTRNPVACPAASQIGTVEIETPPLPAGSLKGSVYLGQQLSREPASGNEFRVFVDAESTRFGISVRLVGNVSANPATGQLTTTFDEPARIVPLYGELPHGLPQAPFTEVKLSFDRSKATLTSPPTCGPNETTSVMEPWSLPGTSKMPSSKFALTSAPGGGACPATLAARPFSPSVSAGPATTTAGAYTPLEVHLQRPDGAQEVRRIELELPPGMVAKLSGLEYCPEASIAAAEANAGTAEAATPSCPQSSFVGTASIDAGSGSNPLHVNGSVYFAGPYKGAPVSLVFVTPAAAGPFDLGTNVVRTALFINPETVQVRAVSDAIPYVFGGVKLDIRRIDININRQSYTLNPTNCSRLAIRADVFGGGSDPANPADWSSATTEIPFQATGCSGLRFKPGFKAIILGGKRQARRLAHPPFRAILTAHGGEANVAKATFILPRSTILDQSHISQNICTKAPLEEGKCPAQSVYGFAEARSPLVSGPLKGPVYLTSSKHELPDLVADLRGQVNVRLRGVISAVHGRLKTVFPHVPDVAVRKFTLTMRGGKRGLIVNTENLCARRQRAFLSLTGQNGKKVTKRRLRLVVKACRHHRRR